MIKISNLLLDEQPLIIQKSLAEAIGLNESIVVQQIHYWIVQNKKTNRNFKDGYYWTYNSFEKWHDEFPFWSVRTIKRIFTKLENQNIIISANYNKAGFDRTKWYRINYTNLDIQLNSHKLLLDSKNISQPLCQNGTMESDNMTPPIPETSQRLTDNGLNRQYNGIFPQVEKIQTVSLKKDKNEDVKQFIEIYMNDLYKRKTGKIHKRLKKEQYSRVFNELSDFCYTNSFDLEVLIDIAIQYLNSDIYSDYNINHFANLEILRNRAYELGYCPESDYYG